MAKKGSDAIRFISFDSCECPKCGQALARDEVEENLLSGQEFFICPYCHQVSNVEDFQQ